MNLVCKKVTLSVCFFPESKYKYLQGNRLEKLRKLTNILKNLCHDVLTYMGQKSQFFSWWKKNKNKIKTKTFCLQKMLNYIWESRRFLSLASCRELYMGRPTNTWDSEMRNMLRKETVAADTSRISSCQRKHLHVLFEDVKWKYCGCVFKYSCVVLQNISTTLLQIEKYLY